MKRIILALVIVIAFFIVAEAFANDTYVNPYFRKDGTYVPGHHRSTPDGNKMNNYSTQGNVNPYTGKPGYVDPYKEKNTYPQSNPYRR